MISNNQKKDNYINQKKIAKKIIRIIVATVIVASVITPIITHFVYNNQYKFIKKEIRLLKREDSRIVSNYSNFYFESKDDRNNGLYSFGVIKSYQELENKLNNDLAYHVVVDPNIINNTKAKILGEFNEEFFKEHDLLHINYHLIDVAYFLTSDLKIVNNVAKIPYLNTKTIFEKEYVRDNYYLNANFDETKTEIKFFKIKKSSEITNDKIDVFEIRNPYDIYNYSIERKK